MTDDHDALREITETAVRRYGRLMMVVQLGVGAVFTVVFAVTAAQPGAPALPILGGELVAVGVWLFVWLGPCSPMGAIGARVIGRLAVREGARRGLAVRSRCRMGLLALDAGRLEEPEPEPAAEPDPEPVSLRTPGYAPGLIPPPAFPRDDDGDLWAELLAAQLDRGMSWCDVAREAGVPSGLLGTLIEGGHASVEQTARLRAWLAQGDRDA